MAQRKKKRIINYEVKQSKGKFFPVRATKVYRVSRTTVPLIVNLSSSDGEEWLTSRPGRFTPGNETQYSVSKRLGGRRYEDKNPLPLPAVEPRTD